MLNARDVLGIFLVPILWGITNAFIKRGTEGLKHVHGRSKVDQFLKEVAYLVTNINYLIPFLVNQLGSVVFYVVLSSADVSLVVPLCNSLTIIVTVLMGFFLGEVITQDTLLGMGFVLAGVVCCISARLP